METNEVKTPENTDSANAEAQVTPPEENTASESTTTPDYSELIAIINRFAPGSDTSSADAIAVAVLPVLKSLIAPYDKFLDLAMSSQENAAFLNDYLETGNVLKSIARNFEPEQVTALAESMAENDDLEEDRKIYGEKVKAMKDRESFVNKNMEVSQKDIAEFYEERKDWPEEKAQAFEEFVINHYQNGADGFIPKNDLEMLEKAFTYDDKVAELENEAVQSHEAGRVAGLNEKIERGKVTRKELAELLPEIDSGVSPTQTEKPKSFGSKFMDGVI